MKHRLLCLFITSLIISVLLSGCSNKETQKETPKGEFDDWVSTMNQSRIDYMESRFSIDSELKNAMRFEYSEIEGEYKIADGVYESGLNESLYIQCRNDQVVMIRYVIPIDLPMTGSSDDIKDVARMLGLINVVQSAEILFGGNSTSASSVSRQLQSSLMVNRSAGMANDSITISSNNMSVSYYQYGDTFGIDSNMVFFEFYKK